MLTITAEAASVRGAAPQFENCVEPCHTQWEQDSSIPTVLQCSETSARRPLPMLATHNNSVATEESLRLTMRDLATPILRRKQTMSVTFLFVVSVTLLLEQMPFRKYSLPSYIPLLPAHSSAVAILIAILLGLLIGLFLTYLVDYA